MFSSEETDDDDTETECEAINVRQERTIGPEDYTDFQVSNCLWPQMEHKKDSWIRKKPRYLLAWNWFGNDIFQTGGEGSEDNFGI